jgi:hypothetical protein
MLLVERAGRAAAAASAIRDRGHAVSVVEAEPLLPADVFAELPRVTVLCWLMGAGDDLHPEVNGEQLETVLMKVVDTGVRAIVFERSDGQPNSHIEHARDTWHIPIVEIDADASGSDGWATSVADAVDGLLGL